MREYKYSRVAVIRIIYSYNGKADLKVEIVACAAKFALIVVDFLTQNELLIILICDVN